MSKLGLSFYASSVDNIWPGIVAAQPRALCVIDPYHLPPALPPAEQQYWLWRPWVLGTMREHAPRAWFDRVYAEWQAKGRGKFHALQFLNEPNLARESGYPEGSKAAADATVAWGRELLPFLRAAWPDAEIHSPPLSPNVPGWTLGYAWLADLIEDCHVLNVHTYLNDPHSYTLPHGMYPDMPVFISECGDGQSGTVEYGQALRDWAAQLPPYVRAATVYVYNSTNGQDPDWELYQSAALKVLIEATA